MQGHDLAKISGFASANLDFDVLRMPPVLIAKNPLPQTQVVVIVPVRNEAEILQKTLTALANQVDFEGNPLDFRRYEVIVFANNCTDSSAAIARHVAQQHPWFQLHIFEQTLPKGEAHIGRVRQMLMDEAYRRLTSLGAQPGIIASTDGDSQVERQWIAAILYEVACGADAVGGRTVTDRAGRAALDRATRTAYLRFVGYRYLIKQLEACIDPDPFDRAPHHYQFFGANFAVTNEMYAQAGGMPRVTTSEDVAFHRAIVRAGARVRHSSLMRVTTSARAQGRAAKGLADRLSQFQTMGHRHESFWVESAAEIEDRLLARHHLRRYWMQVTGGLSRSVLASQPLANELAVSRDALHQAIEQSLTVGDLFQRVERCQQAVGLWQQRWADVPIEMAIADLRISLSQWRQRERFPASTLEPVAEVSSPPAKALEAAMIT